MKIFFKFWYNRKSFEQKVAYWKQLGYIAPLEMISQFPNGVKESDLKEFELYFWDKPTQLLRDFLATKWECEGYTVILTPRYLSENGQVLAIWGKQENRHVTLYDKDPQDGGKIIVRDTYLKNLPLKLSEKLEEMATKF